MPRSSRLDNLHRFLKRHGITCARLSRSISRRHACISDIVNGKAPALDTILDVEAVLRASGYRVPADLWVDAAGRDHRSTGHNLYDLRDARIIRPVPTTRAGQLQIAARKISFHQLTTKTEETMQPLTPEARKHFGLTLDPFTDEIRTAQDVLWTREHRHVLDLFQAAARRQSFIAVIGEVGSGKTLVKREFLEQRPENLRIIEPLFPDKRRITPNNLLDAILCDLAGGDKITIPARREQKARRVREVLESLEKESSSALLILDEAHDYNRETIRALKRLHEMERGFARLLGIVLIGQLELLPKLNDPTLREVHQRCQQTIMHGLNGSTGDYLAFKLERAGSKLTKVIAPDAITAIEKLGRHKLDQGPRWFGPYPLILNVVTKAAMNLAARLGEKLVTADVVDRAWGTAREAQ